MWFQTPRTGMQRQAAIHGVMRGGRDLRLLDGLVAHWSLDEVSGNRADSHGGYTMTEQGTVGSTSGKIGNAATGFSAANYLANTSTIGQISGYWTAAMWLRAGSNVATNQGILCRTTTTLNKFEYLIDINSDDVRFVLKTSSGNSVVQLAINANATYFVVSWYAGATINISLNGGAPTTTAAPGTPVTEAGSALTIGLREDYSAPFLGAWIDAVSIWNRVLTPAEIATLYNDSAGLTYPFA